MARDLDPDPHCPQAALISPETTRRTEARLEKYRERIQRHHEYLEARERALMMKNSKIVALPVLTAAAIGMMYYLWRGRSKSKLSKLNSNRISDTDMDEFYASNPELLQVDFDKAAHTAKAFPDGYLDTRDQLMVYGLYKQATLGDRTGDAPSKLNIASTEKYKAWGKFIGLSQPYAKIKYIQIISHFASGGPSSYMDSHSNNTNDDIIYEEDEHVDEDGCPVEGDEEELLDGLGIRQSTMLCDTEPRKMEENASPTSRLRYAAIHSDTSLLKLKIREGVNINASDESGQTPLHFAVDRKNVECIHLLLEHDADVNAVDNEGISILLTAVMAGNDTSVIKLLLEKGANPDAEDVDGETPRSWIEEEKDKGMLDLFAKYPKT